MRYINAISMFLAFCTFSTSLFGSSILSPISTITKPVNKVVDNWHYGKQNASNFYNTHIHTFLKKLQIKKTVPIKQLTQNNNYGFATTTGIWINEKELHNHSQAIKLFVAACCAADYALQQPQTKYGIQCISNALISPVIYKYVKLYGQYNNINMQTTKARAINGGVSFITAHILNKLLTVPLLTMNHIKNTVLKAAHILCESNNAWVLKGVINTLEKTNAHNIFNSSYIAHSKPYIYSAWNTWSQQNTKLKLIMEKKAQPDAQCYNSTYLSQFKKESSSKITKISWLISSVLGCLLAITKNSDNTHQTNNTRIHSPSNRFSHLPNASPEFRDRTIEFLGYAGITNSEDVSIKQRNLENTIACAGDTYIHYDETKMRRAPLEYQTFVIAHEVAHYVLQHASQRNRRSQEIEQEADEYAMRLLLHNGYSLAAYTTFSLNENTIEPDRDDGIHPTPRQSVQYMGRIWNEWMQNHADEARQIQNSVAFSQLISIVQQSLSLLNI